MKFTTLVILYGLVCSSSSIDSRYDYYNGETTVCSMMGYNACENNRAELVCSERLNHAPNETRDKVQDRIRGDYKRLEGGVCHGTEKTQNFEDNLRRIFQKANVVTPLICNGTKELRKVLAFDSASGLSVQQNKSLVSYIEKYESTERCSGSYGFLLSAVHQCKFLGNGLNDDCQSFYSRYFCLKRLRQFEDLIKDDIRNSIPFNLKCKVPGAFEFADSLTKVFNDADVKLPLDCASLNDLRNVYQNADTNRVSKEKENMDAYMFQMSKWMLCET